MAVVNIQTFQGIKPINIAGDAPTAEEIERINQAFPKLDDSVDETLAAPTSTEIPQDPLAVSQVDPQAVAPEIPQDLPEIEDLSFRYALGS